MKKILKQKKGITLIALVITIIVLLILAGISISMLSGDNTILQKATDAKQTSERAEAKEQAQMDIMAYIADKTAKHQDTSLDDTKVKEILSDNKSYVKTANDSSFITAKGEHTILYSELYDSSKTNNITVKDINSKIGTAVTGYSAKGATWRVFYADEIETFLIVDYIEELIDYTFPSLEKYSGSIDVRNSAYGAKWNKKWLDVCTEKGESTLDNAKATAYLCDSNNWDEYAVGVASYAVGGPTYELLIASLNESQGTSYELSNENIYSEGIDVYSDELYDTMFSGVSNGIYEGYSTAEWFLATPSNANDSCLAEMSFGGTEKTSIYACASHLRPIVSIPTSKISVNGDVVTVLP